MTSSPRSALVLLLAAVATATGDTAAQAATGAAAPAEAAPAPLAAGVAAPALQVAKWLDDDTPLELGRGTAAMLVFWAPWCGSCVNEFAHLNALVDAAADLPVAIVSISDEPEDKVRALLGKRPLRTRRALDDDGRTFAAYGVRVLPRVVLVDRTGDVAALPRAADVDLDVLRRLCDGAALDLEEARQQPADLDWDQDETGFDARRSLGHVIFESSDSSSGALRFPPDSGRITADGVGFANLLQVAYDARPHEVEASHPQYENFDQVYRVSVKAPDDEPETARAMLREHLQRLIPFAARWVDKAAPTAVLRRKAGAELTGLAPSTAEKSSGMARNGSIRFVRVPIATIVKSLGGFGLGGELVDETGLEGRYDLALEWTPGDRKAFVEALAACGLEVTTEQRTVRRLEVTAPQ